MVGNGRICTVVITMGATQAVISDLVPIEVSKYPPIVRIQLHKVYNSTSMNFYTLPLAHTPTASTIDIPCVYVPPAAHMYTTCIILLILGVHYTPEHPILKLS